MTEELAPSAKLPPWTIAVIAAILIFGVPIALVLVFSRAHIVLNPAIAKAEEAVRAELRDPESAKFSDEEVCGRSQIVSGKVNAKNIYGGYSGKVSFYSDGYAVTVFPLTDNGPFRDQFVMLHRDDDGSIIEMCTAAIKGITASNSSNATDLNLIGYDAVDINAATSESVNAADAALEAASRAVENAGAAVENAGAAVEDASDDVAHEDGEQGDEDTDPNATDY